MSDNQLSAKVSVVVPVYKAEKYLPVCVDSILSQTYKNIQLILIDDGSPDRCGEICDAYAQRDDRVTVIHRQNSGPSEARNCGIQSAVGEYIVFVDADDQLYESSVQDMVHYAEHTGAELVFGGYLDCSPYGNCEIHEFADRVDTKDNLILKVIHGTGGVLWAKMFRHEIIMSHSIRLNPNIHFSEDVLFVLEYIQYIQKWGSVLGTVYLYNRLNEASLTRKRDQKLITSYAVFADELKRLLVRMKDDPKFAERETNQKIISFIDTVLRRAKKPRETFQSICGNSTLFSVIESREGILPISIQLAMKEQWVILAILRKKDELHDTMSMIWHWLVKKT